MRKIAVCYPGDIPSVYTSPFNSMVNIEPPKDCEVKWFRGLGWCQARRRTHMCEQAIEWGADIIAQLDIDQVYEPDILKRLLARYDEGYKIIAAMVPVRGYLKDSKVKPFGRLAWRSTEGGKAFEPVKTSEGEVLEVDFPTSACVLFGADALLMLPKPWYYIKYSPETWKMIEGEDGDFFLRMGRIGIKSYVDTTIKVKHAYVFEIDETYSKRFPDWKEGGEDAN